MTNALARVCVDPLADHYAKLGANKLSMVFIRSVVESIPLQDPLFDIVTSINNFEAARNLVGQEGAVNHGHVEGGTANARTTAIRMPALKGPSLSSG